VRAGLSPRCWRGTSRSSRTESSRRDRAPFVPALDRVSGNAGDDSARSCGDAALGPLEPGRDAMILRRGDSEKGTAAVEGAIVYPAFFALLFIAGRRRHWGFSLTRSGLPRQRDRALRMRFGETPRPRKPARHRRPRSRSSTSASLRRAIGMILSRLSVRRGRDRPPRPARQPPGFVPPKFTEHDLGGGDGADDARSRHRLVRLVS